MKDLLKRMVIFITCHERAYDSDNVVHCDYCATFLESGHKRHSPGCEWLLLLNDCKAALEDEKE